MWFWQCFISMTMMQIAPDSTPAILYPLLVDLCAFAFWCKVEETREWRTRMCKSFSINSSLQSPLYVLASLRFDNSYSQYWHLKVIRWEAGNSSAQNLISIHPHLEEERISRLKCHCCNRSRGDCRREEEKISKWSNFVMLEDSMQSEDEEAEKPRKSFDDVDG